MRYLIAICNNKTCYYGLCKTVNRKKYCRCDEQCTVLMKPVCGYNKEKKNTINFQQYLLDEKSILWKSAIGKDGP